MVKKQHKKVIRILLIVALGVYILSYSGLLQRDSMAVVPTYDLIQEGTNSFSPYTCPSDVHHCDVVGRMICNDQIGQQVVIFRNSDPAYGSSSWIAIDPQGDTEGSLEPYQKRSHGHLSGCGSSPVLFYTKEGYPVNFKSGNVCILMPEPDGAKLYREGGDDAVLSRQPTAPYAPNREVYGGTQYQYSCSARVYEGGIQRETLICQSDSPCQDQTNSYFLDPGEEFSVVEETTSDIEIDYEVWVEILTCPTGDKICQDGSVYECDGSTYNLHEVCSYGCENAKCLDAFEITGIELKDFEGNEKTTFKKDEPITFWLTIITPTSVDVTATIKKGNPIDGQVVQTLPTATHTSGRKSYQFTGIQYTGTYYVTLSIELSTGETVPYGTEAGETIPFTVSTEFDATFRLPYQTIAGETNREKLYANYPIVIELVTKSGLDDIFLDSPPTINRASIGTTTITLPAPEVVDGLYTYTFTPSLTGNFDMQATATYGGLPKQVSVEAQIIPENVQISWNKIASEDYDSARVYSMEVGKPYDFEFETRNLGGDLIDSGNELVVYEVTKDVSRSNLISKKSTGRYEFAYTPMEVGGYEFKITSSGASIESSTLTSGQIQASTEPPAPGCVQDDECGFLEKCIDGKCGLKLDLLVVAIGAIFLLFIISVLTGKFLKGRKPSFEL